MAGQRKSLLRSTVRTMKPRRPGNVMAAILGLIGMSVVGGILTAAALTPVVAASGAAASSGISIFENLPDHIDPGQLAAPSHIYAKDGDGNRVQLAQFYAQNRVPVKWNQVSQFAKDAAVSEEDPRFYTHSGVDVLAASRALAGNLTGNNLSGASTITMQYVKNVLIQEAEMIPNEEERNAAYKNAVRQDMDRKLKEMKLAISVEKKFSKDDILLGYLNIANYGGQIYGIEAAAKRYFNTTAADLTLPQAASLIAIVNAPGALQLANPDNFEANKKRRDRIINSMLREGTITQEQHDQAIETPIETSLTTPPSGCQQANDRGLGHFCNYVVLQVLNDPKFGETQAERWYNFQHGGYKIDTTIDLDMQQAAVDSMSRHIPALSGGALDLGGAVVSVEVGTGRVLAMAQNREFNDNSEALKNNPALTSVNYNTDFNYGGSSGFQIGSQFKAFTAAEWLREGHSGLDIVNASARTVNLQDFHGSCLPGDGIYGYGPWKFQNASSMGGRMTVTKAMDNSLNGGFVSMAQQLDLCKIYELAEDMGIHRAAPQNTNPGLSNYQTQKLTIVPSGVFAGIDEVAPISVATAYAGFAGQGKVCTPNPIEAITGQNGEPVEFTKSECKQAISKDVANGTAKILKSGVDRGIAKGARSATGVPHLGKTGTTDDLVDHWLTGSSTKVATTAWVGNVTGKRSLGLGALYDSVNKIVPAVLNVADQKYGGDDFPEPPPVMIKEDSSTVPNVVGQDVDAATQTLTAAGFNVTVGDPVDSDQPEGKVASTDPAAGASVSRGSTVTISPSNGNKPGSDEGDGGDNADEQTIPGGVVGSSAQDAATTLADAGYQDVYMQCQNSGTPRPNMRVVSVDPGEGAAAPGSGRVTLTVNC